MKNEQNTQGRLRHYLPIFCLALLNIGAKGDSHVHQMSIDPLSRSITKHNIITGKDTHQRIPGPGEYINCDPAIKRHFKGKLVYSSGLPAKFFPIMDRTKLKVWATNKLGEFDFEYPGGCAVSIGTYGYRSHGVAFKFIKAEENELIEDIHIMDDVYVVMLSEDVADWRTQKALLSPNEQYSTWPETQPLTCVEGKVPIKAIDFYPFLIHTE